MSDGFVAIGPRRSMTTFEERFRNMISTPLFRLHPRRRASVTHRAMLWVEALETRFCPNGTPVAETIAHVTQEPETQVAEAVAVQKQDQQKPAAVINIDQSTALQASLL